MWHESKRIEGIKSDSSSLQAECTAYDLGKWQRPFGTGILLPGHCNGIIFSCDECESKGAQNGREGSLPSVRGP